MLDYSKFNNFIAVDIGYGDVKIALNREDGSQLITKFPSAVAPVVTKKFGMGQVKEFEGQFYLVGEAALNYKPIEMNDYETLERFAPLLIEHVFELYGEFDTIVTGLSIRQEKNSENFKARLSNFVVNGYEYNTEVFLLPQGIGAKLIVEDDDSNVKDYLICDGGFNTVDLVPVFDGKAEVHAVDALENRGIIEVVNELIDHISIEYDIELSPKEAKEVLDKKTFKSFGEDIDLSTFIDSTTLQYSRNLVKQIERKFKSSWHNFDRVVVAGGLSHFINTSVYKHLIAVPNGEYYNVLGFKKFAEKNIKPTPEGDKKTKKIKRGGTL